MKEAKMVFWSTVILCPVCFIMCAMDIALGIVRLTEKRMYGILFLFVGAWLFYSGYSNAKKVFGIWRMIKWTEK